MPILHYILKSKWNVEHTYTKLQSRHCNLQDVLQSQKKTDKCRDRIMNLFQKGLNNL